MQSAGRRINHRSVFTPRTEDDDNAELSKNLIISARKTGQLNLASRGLSAVPARVWHINDLTKEELKELDVSLDFAEEKERWWEQDPLKALNLSSNSLTQLDPRVQFLSELNILDLHDNLIELLLPEIGSLGNLKKLDLSFNKLQFLPLELYKLSEMRSLDLGNNILAELNPAVGDLIMLENLNLSCNNLTSLPVGMGYLVRLVSLDLSHNMLKELPPDITSMRVLKKLDASFNHLEILPPMGELRRMEILILHTNNLSSSPDTTGCAGLRELHLANNNISEIDVSCLESMAQLRTLTLGNNKIEMIPEEIVLLCNLERLDLSNNNISNIPACISIMPNLQTFAIDGNDIRNVRRDVIQCGTPRLLRYLRESVDVESIQTKGMLPISTGDNKFPDKYAMRNGRSLSLAHQNLQEIPESVIEDASAAEVLCIDLSKNRLTELPNKFSMVSSVMNLKLRCNNLMLLPDWIGEKYNRLQFIDVSNNQLSSLPDGISLLDHLQEINISQNRFKEIPVCIYDAIGLEILIANDNQISSIDVSSLSKLQRLATLDLSNNSIAHVPPELGNLKKLRSLTLSGNCFKQPRQATLAKGTEEVLAYLRDRIPS